MHDATLSDLVLGPGRGGGTVVTYRAGRAGAEETDVLTGAATIRDALDFRRVVEPGAAYLAARREATDGEAAWLRGLEDDVLDAEGDRHRHRLADARLHLGIAALCGSPTLIEAVTRAQESLRVLLAQMPVFMRNIEHSHRQHADIVQAVIDRDADAARASMERHCDATSALLRGLVPKENCTS